MKKLYFIRHGLSEGNKAEIWSGRTDHPLASEGREQAKAAGHKAKDLKIDLIICSPLSRARETAEIIAEQIGYPKDRIMVADILKERSWGELENTPHSQFDHYSNKLDAVPHIEKSGELIKRAEAALRSLESMDADNILVVSHGTFGRALRHHLIKDVPFVDAIGRTDLRLPNGEIICWL